MDWMSRPPGLISVWFLEMDFGELRAPLGQQLSDPGQSCFAEMDFQDSHGLHVSSVNARKLVKSFVEREWHQFPDGVVQGWSRKELSLFILNKSSVE
jgi:hypothetical protein